MGTEITPIAEPVAEKEEKPSEATSSEVWGTDVLLKVDLIPGDPELHPCFDVSITTYPRRAPTLSTDMATLCRKSFEMGARVTDFGSHITTLLPYPCSQDAWSNVGSIVAALALEELVPITETYKAQLDCVNDDTENLEAILNVVGELWRSTCINIVRDEGYESERAMMCFVTLHYLLLCLADECPELRSHAAKSVQEFLDSMANQTTQNLKVSVPDLGRFLIRFLLSEEEAPLRSHASPIVRELFCRNVRWVPPESWARHDASEPDQKKQIDASFVAGHFGFKLTVFQSYYILRSAELKLNTLVDLQACAGKPSTDMLRVFQQDCKRIKSLAGYDEFFRWLQLESVPDTVELHKMLCKAVDESEERGYNVGVR